MTFSKVRKLIFKKYYKQISYSKQRKHPKPTYTKEELLVWFYKQPNFTSIMRLYIKSKYVKGLQPSVDRINCKLPYTLDNIQLLTWDENNKKGYIENGSSVIQYTLLGEHIKSFNSLAEANRKTKTDASSIAKVCRGHREQAGGFKWKYKEVNNGRIYTS